MAIKCLFFSLNKALNWPAEIQHIDVVEVFATAVVSFKQPMKFSRCLAWDKKVKVAGIKKEFFYRKSHKEFMGKVGIFQHPRHDIHSIQLLDALLLLYIFIICAYKHSIHAKKQFCQSQRSKSKYRFDKILEKNLCLACICKS